MSSDRKRRSAGVTLLIRLGFDYLVSLVYSVVHATLILAWVSDGGVCVDPRWKKFSWFLGPFCFFFWGEVFVADEVMECGMGRTCVPMWFRFFGWIGGCISGDDIERHGEQLGQYDPRSFGVEQLCGVEERRVETFPCSEYLSDCL